MRAPARRVRRSRRRTGASSARGRAPLRAAPRVRLRLRVAGADSLLVYGDGLLAEAGALLAARLAPSRAAVVSSAPVFRRHGRRLVASLRAAGFRPVPILLPDGERAKSLDVAAALYRALVAARLDRASPVIALGGGTVSDAVGFVAATFLRGVPFVAAPTTLLAQVDAAIGGKTAVNLPEGKNLVGAFHQPLLVLADTSVLRTLPDREYRAGLAEVVKVGAALDAGLFRALERGAEALRAREPRALRAAVVRAARWKARIVGEDERDVSGRRALLNYGHTVGHALEAVAGYRGLRHGEAVAIGIVAAARLSARLGLLSSRDAERQEALLARLGLPTRVPRGVRVEDLLGAAGRDKKALRGRLRCVLTGPLGSSRLLRLKTARELGRILAAMGCGREGGAR